MMGLSRSLSISLGCLACWLHSLRMNSWFLLFSRERASLCVIFTALLISLLWKMGESSASLAWSLWNETQGFGKLITRKVQTAGEGAEEGLLVRRDQVSWVCGASEHWWKQSFTGWAAERLGQIVIGSGEVNVAVLASKLWNMQRSWKAAQTQNMHCYLCHDLPTEVVVTRFSQSQRIQGFSGLKVGELVLAVLFIWTATFGWKTLQRRLGWGGAGGVNHVVCRLKSSCVHWCKS